MASFLKSLVLFVPDDMILQVTVIAKGEISPRRLVEMTVATIPSLEVCWRKSDIQVVKN